MNFQNFLDIAYFMYTTYVSDNCLKNSFMGKNETLMLLKILFKNGIKTIKKLKIKSFDEK
jgi:hypothetical protein